MSVNSDDNLTMVAALANRLRMIQIDFADESEQVRLEHLNEELARTLENIPSENRQEFLEQLHDQFPSWQSPSQATDYPPPPAGEQVSLGPDELLDRLLSLLPSMTREKKLSLTQKLQNSELAPASKRDWPDQCPASLQELLPPDKANVDPQRLAELLALLFDFAVKLDPLVWSTWRKISPRSTFRHTADMKKTLLGFLAENKDFSESREMLERLRCLIAGIVSSVSQAGNQFARHHLSKLAPRQISDMVNMEGLKFYEAKEVRYWRKYTELSNTINEASLEAEIMELIAKYAESLMKGLRH